MCSRRGSKSDSACNVCRPSAAPHLLRIESRQFSGVPQWLPGLDVCAVSSAASWPWRSTTESWSVRSLVTADDRLYTDETDAVGTLSRVEPKTHRISLTRGASNVPASQSEGLSLEIIYCGIETGYQIVNLPDA
jgi:hypothetical protein